MRIALHCRSIVSTKRTGVGRYTWQLIEHLKKFDEQNQYLLYCPCKLFSQRNCVPNIGIRNFYVKKDYFGRGAQKSLGKIDLIHYPSPDQLLVNQCKIVVTIHDLVYKTFPQGHTASTVAITDKQLTDIVHRADRIICCSNNTRRDLHEYFKLEQDRSCVVYQGVNRDVFYRIDAEESQEANRFLKKNNINEPYILFVGTIEPRKNLVNLVKAFSILKEQGKFRGKLVIVGMKGWMSEGIPEYIQELKVQSSVIFMGFVSDAELRVLYNKAEVFVFPSFYEGFGFPIVEAMSCGVPVITSNVSSCSEVAADAALTVAPQNPEEIVDAITRILENGMLRNSLIEKGLKRSQEFCFYKTARETLNVYKEVCGY